MRVRGLVWLSLSVIAFSALPAAAQDKKVGVTMGYPAAIGLLWRASDKVAVRPELNFTGGSGESSGTFVVESDSWAIGTGVSVLFYLKKYDRLQTYFAPRFSYAHTSSSSDIDGPVTTPEASSSGNTTVSPGCSAPSSRSATGSPCSARSVSDSRAPRRSPA